ncbi:MAG: hypothetical protein IJ013_05425 [Bacteroidaceae bacterium]|nr:hypothetical protein [Bacteroidaceae bacterium]
MKEFKETPCFLFLRDDVYTERLPHTFRFHFKVVKVGGGGSWMVGVSRHHAKSSFVKKNKGQVKGKRTKYWKTQKQSVNLQRSIV